MRTLSAIALLLALAGWGFAQEMGGENLPLEDIPTTQTTGHHAEQAEPDPAAHPILSSDSSWTFNVIVVIAAMFAGAAPVGPFVRKDMPEEFQPSHDDHGDDHGHGHDAHGHH